ncbi:MAG: ATP-binding protein [Planctomycetes bacterium]|nr:ATP-binding protein [Planctomycetota bacterium]
MHDPEALLRDFARTLSRGAFGRRATVRSAPAERELFDGPKETGAVPVAGAAVGSAAGAAVGPAADATVGPAADATVGPAADATVGPAADAAIEEGEIRARRSARIARPAVEAPGRSARGVRKSGLAESRLPLFEAEERSADALAPEAPTPRWSRHPALSGGGGFETFAVDEENRLAFRAVLETAQRPGALAKLVFLHGTRGTGKTHLLRACVDVLASKGVRVVQRDAERLTQEFTTAVAEGRVNVLLESLGSGDAFCLDEVHRLGQRKATRAFAARLLLHYLEKDRLVLIASRYHPRQVHGLEERQISLFLSGFSVQVRPPAEATKERWLRQRHRLLTGEEPTREMHRLSRAIRGGLGDLAAAHDRFLFGAEIEELAGLFGEGMPAVVAATSERLGIDAQMLGERASSRALSRARDIASHVALRLGYRAEIVGRHLGGRRPQTVRAAARRVADALASDAELRAAVESILMRLSG